MKISITGHRPNKLYGYNIYSSKYDNIRKSFNKTLDLIEDQYGKIDIMYNGMALGFDTISFEEVYFNDQRDILINGGIPFKNQYIKWNNDDIDVYNKMIKACHSITYVDELDTYKIKNTIVGEYHPAKMQKRNEWMVDNSDILISCWDGNKKGGTWNCIKYALKKTNILKIYNINPHTFEIIMIDV